MLTLLTGTPGSGKTLYAIDIIVKINSTELKEFENIKNIYNNISGFKFEYFNKSLINNIKLNYNWFYVHLSILHKMFLQNQTNQNLDEILQEYCIKNNIFDSYFIIDEAHNYFETQDKIINWWFTYHRHLHHEILLITQNKTLINQTYRNIPEIFVRALPVSKLISKTTLRYFNYTDFRMSKKYSTTQIKIDPTYFDLYKSGNKSNQKLVGVKYIKYFIVFLTFFILISIYFYFNFFKSPAFKTESKPTPKTESKPTPKIEPKPLPKIEEKLNLETETINLKLYSAICIMDNCYIKYNLHYELIPYSLIKNILNLPSTELIDTKFKPKRIIFDFITEPKNFSFLNNSNISNIQTNINAPVNLPLFNEILK
ncbi:MAG: zonular occludens toxin domain-containing protein [Thermoplasmata archaeon]